MKVRPVKADLKDGVKIGQGAIGSYEKAPPEHRVNPANPNVDNVSFRLRIVFHDAAQPIRWTTPWLLLAPGLKCSQEVVIRQGLRYAIVKVTNDSMTAHKGVWSWTAQEVH